MTSTNPVVAGEGRKESARARARGGRGGGGGGGGGGGIIKKSFNRITLPLGIGYYYNIISVK